MRPTGFNAHARLVILLATGLRLGGQSTQPVIDGYPHQQGPLIFQRNERVDQVRYRFVPSSFDASHDCDEIFANCPE
ncbi:MAG: hypothetical protein GDA68_17135 [Nitrospira sp. CR2.1]|nr:hypothetical protein [Nitrospira sp. CR2.1]